MGYTKEQREAKKEKILEDNREGKVKFETTEKVDKKEKKTLSIKNLSPSTTSVWIKSNCYGELVYVSKKTGFQTSWNNFGTQQSLTLEELITMRNTYIKFFSKNWIVISGFVDSDYEDEFSVEEILEYLQVKQYYKDSLCPDSVDDIFSFSVAEIEKRVPNMSSGIKNSILVRANDLIKNGELDSLKVIMALEKVLSCELGRPE